MKVYEKPKLMVLSISANDALCSGCDDTVRYDVKLREYLGNYYGNAEGPLTDDELANLFEADSCLEAVSYDGYCKFTGTNMMFSS